MPRLLDLSPEELSDLTARQVIVDLGDYERALDQIEQDPDVAGVEITPEKGESRALIKRRLTRAAHMRGKKLKYKRIGDDRLMAIVIDKVRR